MPGDGRPAALVAAAARLRQLRVVLPGLSRGRPGAGGFRGCVTSVVAEELNHDTDHHDSSGRKQKQHQVQEELEDARCTRDRHGPYARRKSCPGAGETAGTSAPCSLPQAMYL